MAFTVQDFHDLVRLLGEHPDWREELRRLVLTDDLLRLPRLVEELGDQTRLLAEAQRRTEARVEALAARIDALAEAQQRTEARLEALTARVDALAEAQQRTEARMGALVEAQQQTERRLAELAEHTDRRFRDVQAELKDLGDAVGALKGFELERVSTASGPRDTLAPFSRA